MDARSSTGMGVWPRVFKQGYRRGLSVDIKKVKHSVCRASEAFYPARMDLMARPVGVARGCAVRTSFDRAERTGHSVTRTVIYITLRAQDGTKHIYSHWG